MAKRTKYVYSDNSAIAHLWIGHNLSGEGQDSARNPRYNFYFSGATIFSYGSHFPMASFVRNGNKRAIQFTVRKYSNTTAGHLSTVRDAINGNELPVFRVYHASDSGKSEGYNFANYLARIREAIANQEKSRSTRNMADYRFEALSLVDEFKAYCKFWGIKAGKLPKVPALPADFDARKQREATLQAARDERNKEKQRLQRMEWDRQNAEKIAQLDAAIIDWNERMDSHIADWVAGGSLGLPNIWGSYYDRGDSKITRLNDIPTLLRIKDGEVETSRHATFPITHAKRGLALVRAVMKTGIRWEANGHTCKLGLYAISKIEGDGTVYAGCHVVPWSSIERIEAQLDAYQEPREQTMPYVPADEMYQD